MITPIPPLDRTSATFRTDVDNFFATAFPAFSTEMNAAITAVDAHASTASAGAATATASKIAAAASEANALQYANNAAAYAGAVLWVSGTTYAVLDVRISPADGRLYRRLIAGAGTTDPSADPTNWQVFQYSKPIVTVTGTSVTAQSGKHYQLKNVAATTVTMPASMAPGDEVEITVGNALATNIVNPNGKTIEGTSGNMTIDYSSTHFTLRFIDSDLKVN